MLNLPGNLERFYADGADWPATPEQRDAERAFRDAFLEAAREAALWPLPDKGTLDAAWNERRRTRDRNEVLVPSSIYYYTPGLDSEQVATEPDRDQKARRLEAQPSQFPIARGLVRRRESPHSLGIPSARTLRGNRIADSAKAVLESFPSFG